MKVLILTLFLVAGALAKSAVKQPEINAEGPKCPVDDPMNRAGPIAINVTVDPIVKLDEGSEITNLIAEGLSSLWYKIELNALLLTATFEVKIERATGNATYSASGYVDARPFRQETIPSGNLTGSGLGKVSASGVYLKGSVSIFLTLTGKVQVSRLNLDNVDIESLTADLGTVFTIGGSPVDWASLSANFKANFDKDLADNKAAITEKLILAANGILVKFSLEELIELITKPGDCDATSAPF